VASNSKKNKEAPKPAANSLPFSVIEENPKKARRGRRSPAERERREHAERVLSASRDRLMRLPSVVAVDVGPAVVNGEPTDELAILVFVSKKHARAELGVDEVLPDQIDGVRLDVLPCSLRPANASCSYLSGILGKRRGSLRGGVAISSSGSGDSATLGILGHNANGEPVALTVAHLLSGNDWIGQPKATRRNDLIGVLDDAELSEQMDAALIRIDPDRRGLRGGVAGVGGPSRFGRLELDADRWTPVMMVGACSGWRYGGARLSSTPLPVDYPQGQLFMDTHIHLISRERSRPFNVAGDSGALLLSADGDEALGLVIASGRGADDAWVGLATPIDRIVERFGVVLSSGD